MQPPSLQPLIYKKLFPRPQPSDPSDFLQFVAKCIIPEVRQESVRFYGHEDSLEASYPGLDYASKAHRNRLRLYTWHRRLFRVFDDLRLSEGEIHMLCRWEGTKYSKEKYERENRTRIRDSTWDGVKEYGRPFVEVASVRAPVYQPLAPRQTDRSRGNDVLMGFAEDYSGEISETEDEIFTNSVGTDLQQRLIAATEARARGEPASLDPAWEQWMKDVTERGLLSSRSFPSSSIPRHYPSFHPSFTSSPRMHQISVQRSPGSESYRYGPTTSSPSSRIPPSDSHRRMAPPPLLPRMRVTRPSGHRSSAPAN